MKENFIIFPLLLEDLSLWVCIRACIFWLRISEKNMFLNRTIRKMAKYKTLGTSQYKKGGRKMTKIHFFSLEKL